MRTGTWEDAVKSTAPRGCNLKYMDELVFIRPGGGGRGGKMPDRLTTVYFVKVVNDGQFAFLYTKDSDQIGYGSIERIVSVNGVPV